MNYNRVADILIALIIGVLLNSCSSIQPSVEKTEKAQLLNEQIESFHFKFNATHAYPQSYKSIYLSSYYDVKVSLDTVQAYLPYYGRAYTAPIDPNEGGIKFVSTNFDYNIKEGKKAGNWLITIQTKDTSRPYTLYFDLWNNGTARLSVHDRNKQTISFQGDIEAY